MSLLMNTQLILEPSNCYSFRKRVLQRVETQNFANMFYLSPSVGRGDLGYEVGALQVTSLPLIFSCCLTSLSIAIGSPKTKLYSENHSWKMLQHPFQIQREDL